MPSLIDVVKVVFKRKEHNASDEFAITRLISQRKWMKVRQFLEITDTDTIKNDYQQQRRNALNDKFIFYPSIVHYACMFKPPLFIIEQLVKAHEESVFLSNKNRWYPLQLACRHSASVDVIKYLLYQNPNAVRELDQCGKTTLHLVFEKGQRTVPEMVHVIRILADVYLSGEGMDDYNNISESEFAELRKTYDLFIEIANLAIKNERERQDLNRSQQPLSMFAPPRRRSVKKVYESTID